MNVRAPFYPQHIGAVAESVRTAWRALQPEAVFVALRSKFFASQKNKKNKQQPMSLRPVGSAPVSQLS